MTADGETWNRAKHALIRIRTLREDLERAVKAYELAVLDLCDVLDQRNRNDRD